MTGLIPEAGERLPETGYHQPDNAAEIESHTVEEERKEKKEKKGKKGKKGSEGKRGEERKEG